MNQDEFDRLYGGLAAEMTNYWDHDEATGREEDDWKVAQLWLNYVHPEKSRFWELTRKVNGLKHIIDEAREALANLDECAPWGIAALNLGRINTPAQLKAWLEKMIPIWEEVRAKVEVKWREHGGYYDAEGWAHGGDC